MPSITKIKESALTVTRQIISNVLNVIFYINPFVVSVVDEGFDNTLQLSNHIYEGGFNDNLTDFNSIENGGFDTV